MASAEAVSPDERNAFRARIERHSLIALWETLGAAAPLHAAPACVPALWRYRDVRALVIEAAGLSRHDVEQRALVLENPGLRGASSITHSLYAGLHAVLPGEVASRQRPTRWSLRLLMEGDGAYSVHEGQRADHLPGDFVVVASWSLQHQGNDGATPAVWFEGIEVPTMAPIESLARTLRIQGPCAGPLPGDGLHAAEALPPDSESDTASAAYPHARMREALAGIRRTRTPHPSRGFGVRCAASATLEVFVELLPAGFCGRPSRATHSTVYCVIEGRGESRIGGETIAWEARDIFVVPSWCSTTHAATEEAVLLGYSDRPAQQAVGLWQEEILG